MKRLVGLGPSQARRLDARRQKCTNPVEVHGRSVKTDSSAEFEEFCRTKGGALKYAGGMYWKTQGRVSGESVRGQSANTYRPGGRRY